MFQPGPDPCAGHTHWSRSCEADLSLPTNPASVAIAPESWGKPGEEKQHASDRLRHQAFAHMLSLRMQSDRGIVGT